MRRLGTTRRWRKSTKCLLVAVPALAALTGIILWLPAELAARQDARTARRCLDEGRLDEAASVLDRWERIQPRAAELHFLRARLAWARNELSSVQKELASARALGCPATATAELRGLLLARTHQTAEAEPLLQQAIDHPGRVNPDVAEALAHIYLGEFRLNRAAGVLERWMRDWPDDARPFFLQTEIDTRNRASDDVILAHLQAALERDPTLDQARLRLAEMLRSLHRNREAAVEYASFQSRRPTDPQGYLGAGQNALDLADLAEAVRCLDRALELSPHDPVILGARAAAAIRQGRDDAARGYLDRAVKADPYDYSNRYQRMLLLNREGKKTEADAERLTLEQIRRDQAEFADLGRQLERDPLNPRLRRQAATWLMTHGHEEEAIDWAKLVLQADPADPAMNRLLADYYQRTGNLGLANLHQLHATPSADRSRSDR